MATICHTIVTFIALIFFIRVELEALSTAIIQYLFNAFNNY